jgi:hypothetical protein
MVCDHTCHLGEVEVHVMLACSLRAINREGRGAVMRFKQLGTLPVVSDADGLQARQLQDSLTHSSSSGKPFIVEAQFECEQVPDRNNPSCSDQGGLGEALLEKHLPLC